MDDENPRPSLEATPRSGPLGLGGALLVCAVLLGSAGPAGAQPTISAVSPSAVSSDASLRLTGTGFGGTAATNEVTIVPASGDPVVLAVTSVASADAAGTIKRVTVTVSRAVAVGRAAVTVRNTLTGLTSAPAAVEIVSIVPAVTSGAQGATLDVPISLTGNVVFDAASSRAVFGAGTTVNRVALQSPRALVANVTISASASLGPRSVAVVTPAMTAVAANAFVVVAPDAANHPPQITSAPGTAARAGRAYEYQVVATDPDNDPLSFLLPTAPSGMQISPAGLVTWTPAAGQAGEHDATVEVRDPAGNTARQTYRITVSPPTTPQSLTVTPALIDLTAAGAVADLTVTGVLSDGSSLDLTTAASGTTYETSHAAVATVSADGVVTAVANGTATITARNAGLSATTQVTVAIPPSLAALAMSPRRTTLRAAGATLALTLTGTFSDGSTRDLTDAPDVIYESSAGAVVTVGAAGLVTAIGTGRAVVTARVGAVSAQCDIDVVIDSGTGFVQGEVFDDRTGLPLGGATVMVLLEGGVEPQLPRTVIADDRGRYVLPLGAGHVLVRVEKAGFTTVDRAGTVPSDGVATLLDARLTPRDTHTTALQAVFGGRARNLAGTVTLDVPAGGLGADTALVLTEISNQGLAGRLPLGWSPVAGVEIGPATARFEVPATLRLPNADGLAPQASVVLAVYDAVRRAWVAVEPAQVSADGGAIAAALQQPGQFVALVADAAPFTPPASVTGEMLAGVGEQMFPAGLTARGVVVPRSAPPGDAARAAGTVLLISPSALPSGLVVRAHVSEQFDLLDQSRVVPLPYTQDLVVYARPRLADDMTLGTRLSITPSRSFTIQQLALGTVRLDVRTDPAGDAGGIVTSTGGSLAGPDGILLDVPAGAVPADTVVGLASLLPSQVPVAVAPGFSVLGAVSVALVGAQFGAPAELSILRPASLDAASQVWLGQVFADPFGVSRLRLAGAVEIQASRLVARAIFAGVPLAGVRGAGTYVFVRADEPLGLLAGTIRQPGGLSPQAGVLATADTAPFADLSAGDGRALLAGRMGVATRVTANDAATGNGGETSTTVPAVQTPAEFTLTLGVVAPSVISTSPAANAANVPLDRTITVFFSEPIAAASITDASAVLEVGGQPVAATRVLSADRRRLTVRPDAPLAGNSVHVLTLTSALQDDGGNGLAAFTPVSFRTLDPSKPPQPAAGQLTAELPDEDGFVLVTATAGVAEPGSAVTATNPRTQESVTVLALADGSFRLRVGAVDGDELTITLRDASGRDFATTLAQFTGADGTTSIGRSGGTVEGPGGRKGRILARALTTAGRFRLNDASAAGLPPLPASLSYLDQFTLATGAARFNTLQSLTLAESQNRFTPAIVTDAPFGAAGSLGVPADFLAGAALRFTATAVDAAGNRAAATAQTLVVASGADTAPAEAVSSSSFPQAFVVAPRQALPNQQVDASAVAPSARVEIQIPAPAQPLPDGTTVLLARTLDVDGETTLALVDRLSPAMESTDAVLGGAGRDLAGVAREGTYAAVAITAPVVFVTGRLTGPAALVAVDGLPFVVETGVPNARFVVPVLANTPFTLRFLDATTFAALGSFNGAATGVPTDVGSPLGPPTATMTVTATPDVQSVVDIAQPIVFTFSEPVAGATVTANAIVVTDPAGSRVPGTATLEGAADGTRVTFTPSRRWRFGTRYRYGVATSVLAVSGARLAAPFSGEFTTFAPRVLGTAALPDVRDVAISGAMAIAATSSGLAVVDLANPAQPAVLSQVPIPGGAHGVALLPAATLTDRTGQPRAGAFAVVTSGGAAQPGLLEIYALQDPAAPQVIGRTQLTVPAGASAPAGVRNAPGTPGTVVVDATGRATVAVRGMGVETVALGQAIPLDVATPGRGLGPRFPASGVEDVVDVAIAGDRVVTIGAAGLNVLEGATLARLGGASSPSNARGIAGAAAYQADLNGDGAIVPETETVPLGLVSGGADGTLQFTGVANAAAPALSSIVRLEGETFGLTLDAAERLATAANGTRGIAFVDLAGGVSVQPIDLDRDGVDDRRLGQVDTPGSASRVATDLALGLAAVADGPAGVTVVQARPPRTVIDSLRRDPIVSRPGDETALDAGGAAFTSDEGIRVRVIATVPGLEALRLVIEERPDPGAPARLTFEDGSTVRPLVTGAHDLLLPIARLDVAGGSAITLRVLTSAGQEVTSASLRLVPAVVAPDAITALVVRPGVISLDEATREATVSVGGILADGRTINLSNPSTGTTYAVLNPRVALVTADGRVLFRAAGRTDLAVTNGRLGVNVPIRAIGTASFETWQVDQTHMTLTRAGEAQALRVQGRMTDGTTDPSLFALGAVMTSSDPSVVTVDANGRITAVGEGLATITVRRGTTQVEIPVAVEFRTPANVSAIDLVAFTAAARTDEGTADATARVAGTGSLEGLTVEFTFSGSTGIARASTDYSGVATARLGGLTTPGTVTVTARVVNPANGAALTDGEALGVVAAGADSEPNDTPANATPMAIGRAPVSGTLAGGDTRDVFRAETRVPGTLVARVRLAPGTDPAATRIRLLDPSGAAVGMVVPASGAEDVRLGVEAGAAFVAVEAVGGASVTYQLDFRFEQGPVAIASVSPLAGGPGTAVTITGSGFGIDPADVRVLFGGVAGKVTASSPAQITALVPANAVNGPVTVIVTSRRATGPAFDAGNAGPRAPVVWTAGNPADVRFDPVSRQRLDVKRVNVVADPTSPRAQVEALAAQLGGRVASVNPVLNTYALEFPANTTLAGLAGVRRQLAASALVRYTIPDAIVEWESVIDARDGSTDLGQAYARARVFDAIEAIRETPPYIDFGAQFQDVKIGIVDTGFAPFSAADFQSAGLNVVTLFRPDGQGVFQQTPFGIFTDPHGHGTAVTSIIAGLNNGAGNFSGVFGGLFRPDEASFNVTVYATRDANGTTGFTGAALTELAGTSPDIVNLSFGLDHVPGPDFDATKQFYRDQFALFGGTTLIVTSAGNGGVQAAFHTPSILESEMPFVMAIAATAVANLDDTGEYADARAIFGGTGQESSALCTPGVVVQASSCGPGITMAAPGEDVLVVKKGAPGYELGAGTSYASPMVAGVAALLQAIRPAGAPFAPDLLRTLLVDSGDDITDRFMPPGQQQPMRRLNALNAVRLVLSSSFPQMIYVADQSAVDGNVTGRLIGIDIDPLTGKRPTPANPDVLVPLTAPYGQASVQVGQPIAVAMSPMGDELYAFVDGGSHGDGLLVVNTRSNRATRFLPFGDAFGAGGAVQMPTLRLVYAFSKDARLLYVGVGTRLAVLNTVAGKWVRSFSDLPAEYRATASGYGNTEFETRQDALAAAVEAGIGTSQGTRSGVSISGLAVSPTGRALYAAVSTGGGGGAQPGGLLTIGIDLYTDADPATPGLQSALDGFLRPAGPPQPMVQAGGFLGGDEPSGVAVSHDGRHVYLVNGGLNFFEAIPPDQLDPTKYAYLLLGATLAGLNGGGTAIGLAVGMAAVANAQNAEYQALLEEMRRIAASGLTLISAPGVTGVFSADPATGMPQQQPWLFPSEVTFGWAPTVAAGGSLINQRQTNFPDVFAKRPFGIAMRPDGRRALLPLFQTGNFAVLDLDAQTEFDRPDVGGLPDGMFQGVAGVTKALRLDNHLWPSRGAFVSSGSTTFMPGPDESLLYTWQAEYAQNGRFAVAAHAGRGSPGPLSGVIPDLLLNQAARYNLQALGYEFDGQRLINGPTGLPATLAPGDVFTAQRLGGAISIIDDRRLTSGLSAQKTQDVTVNGAARPSLATREVCSVPTYAGGPCMSNDVDVSSQREYATAGGTQYFHRPRGVAIQPFVVIESPRFGDRAGFATAFQLTWRDARIRKVTLSIFDLGANGVDTPPAPLHEVSAALSPQQITTRTLSVRLADMFPPPTVGLAGHHYRFVARMFVTVPAEEELSSTSVVVVLDQPADAPPPPPDTLDLSPNLIPSVLTATPAGQFIQLTATLTEASGQASDVTASSDTTYVWIGGISNPLVNQALELAGVDPNAIANDIKNKLSEQLGTPLPFSIANIAVDPQGRLRVLSGGLQIVQAFYWKDGKRVFSAPSVVLAGLELSKIDLEPDTFLTDLASVSGADGLYKKVLKKFGKAVNTPMILVPQDPGAFSFLSSKGDTSLEEVEFTYLGQGRITLNQLIAYLEPLIRKAIQKALGTSYTPQQWLAKQAGARIAAKVAVKLMQDLAANLTLDLVDLKSTDTAVAVVDNDVDLEQGDFLKGEVTAIGPGLGGIKGELDLGPLGKAHDAFPVFVLPNVTSVRPDPANVLLCATDAPVPGRRVRTLATLAIANQVTLTPQMFGVPDDARKIAEYFVPEFLPQGTYFDLDFNEGGDFRFGFRGTILVDDTQIQFQQPEFYFTAPNVPTALIETTYAFPDFLPAGGNVAQVGDTQPLFVRVEHNGQPGRTRMINAVRMPVLAPTPVQGIGSVLVTPLCQTPTFTKINTGGKLIVGTPPDLTFTISIHNPLNTPLENVIVEDVATYFREPPTGAPGDATEVRQVTTVARVEPNAFIDVPFLVPTFGYTRIENRGELSSGTGSISPVLPCQVDPSLCQGGGGGTGGGGGGNPTCATNPSAPECRKPAYCELHPSAPACVCSQPNPPPSCGPRPDPVRVLPVGPIITELVLSPRRDWNDTAGGNGTPFDGTPGNGTVDQDDVWIEVSSLTTATNTWRIRLTDAAGQTYEQPLPQATGTSQTELMTGWGLGASPVVLVQLLDGSGVERTRLDIAAFEQLLGPATGPGDESLTWSIYGSPTLPTQQFVRRSATIDLFLPF